MKQVIYRIMNIMESIEYGFKDKSGKNIINVNPQKWDNDFADFYYLQSREELLETKCGVCWDQVELERDLFNENDIKCKSYFIFISDRNMLPTHTFLTFKDNNKYYWFEHSWAKYKGIHEYISKEDLLNDVINKFKEDHKDVSNNATLYLYQYQQPKKHISCSEFYKYIETQKLIIIEKIKKKRWRLLKK